MVLRNLRVPEQPWLKWAIFPAFAVAAVGVELLQTGDSTILGTGGLVVGLIAMAGWGVWDWFWRNDHGYSTLW